MLCMAGNLQATGTTNSANTADPNAQAMPGVEWVKSEVTQVMQSSTLKTQISDVLDVNVNTLDQSTLSMVKGHFTSTEHDQYIIAIPARAKEGQELGWETNIWLLVEKSATQQWQTLSAQRGDLVYQNALLDVDGDGLQEINMINKVDCGASQKYIQRIFSFKTGNFIYTSEAQDNWSNHKLAKRKQLRRGDLLYSVMQFEVKDIDGDGVNEIVETWVHFKHNGGRRVARIEQNKKMTTVTRVLKYSNGAYIATTT